MSGEKRILLVGNPNAGKSTLFNGLTGGKERVGNWHGVTVGVSERKTAIGGEQVRVCDLPGIYSLQAFSLEERLTRDYLAAHPSSAVLFVAECATLSRSLPLCLQLREEGYAVCLILTKRKQFERRGGRVNPDLVSEELGIPVLVADGRSKASVEGLRVRLAHLLHAPQRAANGGNALSINAYSAEQIACTGAEKLFLNGFFCLLTFFAVILLTFYLTFAPNLLGDRLKGAIEYFFGEYLAGLARQIPSPLVKSLVCDAILGGLGGVLCVLPQIAILFFVLNALEESGFLSHLALHADGAFAAVGLNGRAVFSLLMGFGCTAAAILTTRGLENKAIQRRTVLALPYIPCSAKLPVFLTLTATFFENPFVAVLLLYLLGVGISFAVALLLKGNSSPTFLLELAPLQIPNGIFLLKSLFFQLKQFIIKTATVILAFFLLSWFLSSFDFSLRFCGVEESMLATVCGGLKYLFAPIGCNDWRIAYAALSGLIAKENVAGVIAMFFGEFPYSSASALAFACFIVTCSPCVSAISASAREAGWKRALCYALVQTASALLVSYAVYFALTGGWQYLLCILAFLLARVLVGKELYEKIRRHRKNKPEKVHR